MISLSPYMFSLVQLILTIPMQLQIEDPPKKVDPLPKLASSSKREEAIKLYGSGLLYEKENRLLDALRSFEKALELDPSALSPRKALIPIYMSLDRIEDALVQCRYVLERDDSSLETFALYAKQLAALGRTNEVTEILEKLVDNPASKDKPELRLQVLRELSLRYEQAGNWAKSEEKSKDVAMILDAPSAEETLELTEDSFRKLKAENYEMLGRLALKRKDTKSAIECYLKAQKLDIVRSGRLGFNLAQVYASEGKNEEALLRLDEFLQTQPLGTEAYELKIEIQKKMGRQKDIVPEIELASSRDSHNNSLKLLLARELRNNGQSPRAEAIYEQLANQSPSADVYHALFELYRENKQSGAARALNRLESSIQAVSRKGGIPPDPSQAIQVKAMLLALKKDPEMLRKILDQAYAQLIKGGTIGLETKVALGTLASRASELKAGEKLLLVSLTETPANSATESEVYSGLLRIYRMAHKYQEIVALCKEGLEKAKNTSRVLFHVEMAGAYTHLEKDIEALAAIDLAINESQDRERLFSKRYRASLLAQMGKYQDAEKEALTLLRDYDQPGEVRDIRYTLSSIYSGMKNHEKSEGLLKQILEVDPSDATANNDLGYQWADRSHNLEEAEKLIRKALDLDQKLRDTSNRLTFEPENAAYIDSLGWVLFRRGKLSEARQELEKAASLSEGADDPVVWDHLGDVYFSMKEKQKSLESYKKAINLYEVVKTRRDADRVRDIKQKIELLELKPVKK